MAGRDPRYVEPGGCLVEVSNTTFHHRYLLDPATEGLNDIVVGVFARAQEKYGVQMYALTVMSSHFHAIVRANDQKKLSDFMGFVDGNLSKEVGHLVDWPGALWSDRYHMIPISHEEKAQVARLKYVMANSVKEGLVKRPQDWPGINSAQALMDGTPLVGHWYDRTKLDAAMRRKGGADPEDFAEEERLYFSPLPCWEHLPPRVICRRVAQIVKDIEGEAKVEAKAKAKEAGAKARAKAKTKAEAKAAAARDAKKILSGDPHYRPRNFEGSPKPRFHAATWRVFFEMWRGYAEIFAAYREASARLREGDRDAPFPEGTFPPGLPFVSFAG